MSGERQACVSIDGIEVALYHQGNEVWIYVNQSGVCIHRMRVPLIAELTASDGVVSVDTLRRLAAQRSKAA